MKYLIQNKEEFDAFLDYIKEEKLFAFDLETNAKKTQFDVEIIGISIAVDLFSVYIPLNHYDLDEPQLDIAYVIDSLKPILESREYETICHNIVFDETVMKVYGINVQTIPNDTMAMSWLLDEAQGTKGKGLKPMVKKYLKYKMDTYEDVLLKGKKRGVELDYNFANVKVKDALSYAADDALYTYKLFKTLSRELKKEGIWQAYREIEGPVHRVVREMQYRGIYVDQTALDEACTRFPSLMEQIEAEVFEEAGEVFNTQSGEQLGKILFEKLGIRPMPPRTKTNKYKTDKATLTKYAASNKIVENILRRKKIQKTHSTFVEGTKEFLLQDGKIHPAFNPAGTATGRFSGKNPNMQQIEGDEVEEVKIRDFFVAAPGHVLVVADYSQIELRIMAHFSKDENMIRALAQQDIHEAVARDVFNIPLDKEVTRRQRIGAKTINFGVGYGRGAASVAAQLGINMSEGKELIDKWNAKYPRIDHYKKWLINDARRKLYIRTISGRKRRLPEINSEEWKIKGHNERQAFNTKIQGSAADIIKAAMISMQPELEKIGGGIIIQIHDELVVEAPVEVKEEAVETMQHVMENPLNGKNPLRLPLVAEPVVVDKWGKAK